MFSLNTIEDVISADIISMLSDGLDIVLALIGIQMVSKIYEMQMGHYRRANHGHF